MPDDTPPKIRDCHEQARRCLATHPSIRRLLDALASRGCPFDFDRHLACETTDGGIRGGFDRSLSQVVLYPGNLHSPEELCTILAHELVHAYDHCRAHVDFTDPSHLACTEIRAAALSDQCSLWRHFSSSSRPFLVKQQHGRCVRERARESMQVCSALPRGRLDQIISDVFARCYNDTDPFDDVGRRRRTKTMSVRRVSPHLALSICAPDEE